MPALILDMKIYIFKMWNCLILSKSSVGVVDPFSSLECEVTWNPGFSAPEKGELTLHIEEGDTMTLKCVVHVRFPLNMSFILRALNWLTYVCVE